MAGEGINQGEGVKPAAAQEVFAPGEFEEVEIPGTGGGKVRYEKSEDGIKIELVPPAGQECISIAFVPQNEEAAYAQFQELCKRLGTIAAEAAKPGGLITGSVN